MGEMMRMEFSVPCPECRCRSGYCYVIGESFCTDCGAQRSAVGRILDLPSRPPVDTEWERNLRKAEERYQRRLRWGESTRRQLVAIGAKRLLSHPLGYRHCQHGCKSPSQWVAVARRNRSGHLGSFVYCSVCGYITPSHSISHKLLDPSTLPLFDDNACGRCRGDGCEQCRTRCAVNDCSRFNTELHHILPWHVAIPNDLNANDWPTVYLCRQHHMEWHRLVTPDMGKKSGAA